MAALAEVLAEPGRSLGAAPLSSAFRGIPDPRGVPVPQRLRSVAGPPPAGGLRRGRPVRGAVGGEPGRPCPAVTLGTMRTEAAEGIERC